MPRWRFSTIMATASIGGGFMLTLISGLYRRNVISHIVGTEIVRYGFPFAWLEGTRSFIFQEPWHYYFLWRGFIIDFILYGLLAAAATYVYFIVSSRK